MYEIYIAILVFVCLAGASLGSLFTQHRLPERLRDQETHDIVKNLASVFAVMISLVLGLTMNSARNTFESVDRNVHAIATDIILFDRALRQFGPEGADTRQKLLLYAKRAGTGPLRDDPDVADRTSEALLNAVGASLHAMAPSDSDRLALWNSMITQYRAIVDLRWVVVEQMEGTIPMPLLAMMVIWLALIFASYGYRAPRNEIVVTSFLVASALLAGAIYLILDMDIPFSGPIQVSPAPLQRALTELQS